jgi:hypothetical protein
MSRQDAHTPRAALSGPVAEKECVTYQMPPDQGAENTRDRYWPYHCDIPIEGRAKLNPFSKGIRAFSLEFRNSQALHLPATQVFNRCQRFEQ